MSHSDTPVPSRDAPSSGTPSAPGLQRVYTSRPLLAAFHCGAEFKPAVPGMAVLHGVSPEDAAAGLTGVWATLSAPVIDRRYPIAVLADTRPVRYDDPGPDWESDLPHFLRVTLHAATLVRRDEAEALGLPLELFGWFGRPWDLTALLDAREYTSRRVRLVWAGGTAPTATAPS